MKFSEYISYLFIRVRYNNNNVYVWYILHIYVYRNSFQIQQTVFSYTKRNYFCSEKYQIKLTLYKSKKKKNIWNNMCVCYSVLSFFKTLNILYLICEPTWQLYYTEIMTPSQFFKKCLLFAFEKSDMVLKDD